MGDNNDKKVNVHQIQEKYQEYIKKYSDPFCASSKIIALMERLKYIQNNYDGDKVLVFSNFANIFFKIISSKLNEENIQHLQFHGSMNRKQRKTVLDRFKSSANCRVLLISAKCASVGLNLMCANHVIFVEPRCNPGL